MTSAAWISVVDPRDRLLALLDRYVVAYPGDRTRVARMRSFVRGHADCCERTCRAGHVTASAYVLSPDGMHTLLTHHRKLDRWLQPGGHADGESDPRAVALREVREESGLTALHVVGPDGGETPLDVDVHRIPARGAEPAHVHYDVRYLVIAERAEPLGVSAESHALRWVARSQLRSFLSDESVLRLERKAALLLAPR